MKAMIFAAGLGTRLRPLTDNLPKALVEVNGKPMLELAIERLAAAGVTEMVINTHHFHEQIEAFLQSKDNFGLQIELSREKGLPMETGGGLKKAASFFKGGGSFFACNSDVYSEMDLEALYSDHLATGALATLAVRDRPSERLLLFNAAMDLKGRSGATAVHGMKPFAFSGIQVIDPAIFPLLTETGVFSITRVYLRLAEEGRTIKGFEDTSPFWCDIGDPGRLEAVRQRAAETI